MKAMKRATTRHNNISTVERRSGLVMLGRERSYFKIQYFRDGAMTALLSGTKIYWTLGVGPYHWRNTSSLILQFDQAIVT